MVCLEHDQDISINWWEAHVSGAWPGCINQLVRGSWCVWSMTRIYQSTGERLMVCLGHDQDTSINWWEAYGVSGAGINWWEAHGVSGAWQWYITGEPGAGKGNLSHSPQPDWNFALHYFKVASTHALPAYCFHHSFNFCLVLLYIWVWETFRVNIYRVYTLVSKYCSMFLKGCILTINSWALVTFDIRHYFMTHLRNLSLSLDQPQFSPS